MVGQARLQFRLVVLIALALSSMTGAAAPADEGFTDDACPRFERLHYNYTYPSRVEGDLYEVQHVRGFTDFQECFQVRERILEFRVRYEARSGLLDLRVAGDGFDDRHLLRPGANVTAWYDGNKVDTLEYAGVTGKGEVVTNRADAPPAAASKGLLPGGLLKV